MQLPPERIEEIRRLVVEEYGEFVDNLVIAILANAPCDCERCIVAAAIQAGWQIAEMRAMQAPDVAELQRIAELPVGEERAQ